MKNLNNSKFLVGGVVLLIVIVLLVIIFITLWSQSTTSDKQSTQTSQNSSSLLASTGSSSAQNNEAVYKNEMFPDLEVPLEGGWKVDKTRIQTVDTSEKFYGTKDERKVVFISPDGVSVELFFYGGIGGGLSDTCFQSDKVARTGGRFTRIPSLQSGSDRYYYIENSYVALKKDPDFDTKKSEIVELLQKAYEGMDNTDQINMVNNPVNNVCVQNIPGTNVLFTRTSFKISSGDDNSAAFSILINGVKDLKPEQIKTAEDLINRIKF